MTALAFGYLDGIWAGLIGLVMISTARAQAREVQAATALAGLYVRDVLARSGPAAEAIPGWHTVQSFLDDQAGSPAAAGAGAPLGVIGASAFPLRDFEGHTAGLLTLSQLALVPPGQRDRLRLTDVATPVADVVTTTPTSRWDSCSRGCPSARPSRPPCTRPGTRWFSPGTAPQPGC